MINLHENIGKDLQGFGGHLTCRHCRKNQPLKNVGGRLKNGWPKCCGYTMRWITDSELRILHIPIKKKWFDMIKSGEKKEEYRDMVPHWISRLVHKHNFTAKEFDIVRFRNGYSKDSPILNFEYKGLERRGGREEWGAEPGETYFVILLGNVI